ncbi:hypothetical protein C8F04DRAFT_1271231 [Mycena alexandri]|uniref:Uncharacterized protein n=1 Tax=Mycena alexandri TaxID=1745969 RepID=A0AAD6WUA1_9AGAR|nr:hypothetical protein C8F04DRAFT_1271231 [Mycena alexandri]
MSKKTGECHAKSKDGDEECDCTSYEEDPGQSGYCSECYHREKAHLLATPGASVRKPEVRTLLKSLMEGTKLGSKLSLGASLSSASSSRKKAVPSLSAANRESNEGMRSSKPGSSKGKGKRAESSASTTFKVVSIHVLPYGTEEGKMAKRRSSLPGGHDKTPTNFQIDTAAAQGLAVFDSSKGFELDRTWTHEELAEALMGLLPFPFSYFERLQDEAGDGEAAWRLASVVSKRLHVLINPTPAGKDVDFHKGNATSGFRHWRIFIVAREPIPREFLKNWANQLGGASGSKDGDEFDSETDSGSDSAGVGGSPSPEKIPRTNKRRLVSKASSDEDESIPKKKGKGPAGKTWIRGPEAPSGSKSESVIDLTTDENKAAGPGRASSEESVFEDPLIGNPYEQQIFEF